MGGIAVLARITAAVSAYLSDERAGRRVSADAHIDSPTLSLVGVNTVLADVVQRRSH